VEAAIELFSRRGPDAVLLREVATAAGVNYGLIYQYIGTKDDLLRLAFRSVSENTAELSQPPRTRIARSTNYSARSTSHPNT
jgi:AcrR family transcriptional regulator